MSDKKFAYFFRQVSQIVLTIILGASIALFYKISTMTASDALRTYHSFPYMLEHLLVGVVLYLAFSLIILKIHRSSLHDGR